jgi:hypothetical protein
LWLHKPLLKTFRKTNGYGKEPEGQAVEPLASKGVEGKFLDTPASVSGFGFGYLSDDGKPK